MKDRVGGRKAEYLGRWNLFQRPPGAGSALCFGPHRRNKELIVIEDGHRESELSWQGVLKDLKRRGLKEGPGLAIGDGSLGFWAALEGENSTTKQRSCWVHKTANVLPDQGMRLTKGHVDDGL